MQSLIISSKNKKAQEEFVINYCKDNNISRFDLTIVEKEGSIGIEDVRHLKEKIFLKPLESLIKAIAIRNSEKLTIEAQNALLKVLEEPPNNTVILLTLENSDLLLPTILSRCKIIELSGNEPTAIQLEPTRLSDSIEGGIGEKFKLAQDNAKTREEAIAWLEKMIILMRQKVIVLFFSSPLSYNDTHYYSKKIFSLNETLKIIKTTNVNPRFALENLLLSF